MTTDQQQQFRKEFKSIVYQKSLMADNSNYLKKLHAFDRNGSHQKAILKALESRDGLKKDFEKMLRGYSYEEWKMTGKKLSALNTRLKGAIRRQRKIEDEISKINF